MAPTPAAVKNGAPINETGYSSIQPPAWGMFASSMMIPGSAEDVPDLMWPQSVNVYHKMRADAQIYALTQAITLPIRRFKWSIDPNGASDETTAGVASDFGLPIKGTDENPGRSKRRFNHDDHLRHALLALAYGHMFFEQVGIIDDNLDWRLRKLAPRMPQSIQRIQTAPDGGLAGIVQWGSSSVGRVTGPLGVKPIDVSILAAYVWDREGADWAGRSMYRSLYRHWLLKDRLLRIDAMKNERYGLGIPTGTAPKGANAAQISEYGALARSIKADPDGGVGLPNGASIGIEGVKGSLPDTLASIHYQDEAMARAFLAMFIQLGQTHSGSRALGTTFVDFFQLSVEAVAHWYARITNEHVIEDWVDWNVGEDEPAPLLTYEVDETVAPIAAADLISLITAGVITVDEELQAWARDRWDVPKPTTAPGAGVAAVRNRIKATRRRRAVEARAQTLTRPEVGHRDPNAHEIAASTDFPAIQAEWADATTSLVDSWEDIRAQQIDALVASVEMAVAAANSTMLATLSAPVLGAALIGDHMMAVAEQAIAGARDEALAQGVDIPLVNVAELEPMIRARAEGVAALMARGLSDSAARQAMNRYGVDSLDPAEVAAAVRDHLEELSDTYLQDQLGGALTQAQNTGRRSVMSQRPATYYASELMDSATCDVCEQIDGRSYDSISAAEKDYPAGGYSECLGGSRCRGTLVAVYDEATPSEDDVAASSAGA